MSDLCVGFNFHPELVSSVFPGALKAEPRTFSMTFSPLPIRSVAMVDCTIVGLGWGLGWGLGGTRSR